MYHKNCLICNIAFEAKIYNKLYCSKKCYYLAKKTRDSGSRKERWLKDFEEKPAICICLFCNKEFKAPAAKYKYCSEECHKKGFSLKTKKFLDIPSCLENANKKLDKTLGYVRVYVPMHPEANSWGYVYEHRVVAEQIIGRRLVKGEVVHHKNGKRWDNRPENLEVMNAFVFSKENILYGGKDPSSPYTGYLIDAFDTKKFFINGKYVKEINSQEEFDRTLKLKAFL